MSMYFITLLITFQVIFSLQHSSNEIQRQSKFILFGPFTIARFRNDVCTSLEGFMGTCYTRRECRDINGTIASTCADGRGVCCIATCGDSSAYNNTYFTNPGFPNSIDGSTSCTFTIRKCTSDICQVRLDFLSLNLAQPDGNGNCITDSLIISGGASNVPVICGENTGQHIYVNFNNNSDIVVMISTDASVSYSRSWNIKITQLACACPTLAPTGCLMYYTALSGSVNSFNYGTTMNGALIDIGNASTDVNNTLRPGTRQLVNQNYGACVQMQPGYCSIRWSQGSDATSFTVSGDTALATVIPGLPSGSLIGTNCTTDFVVIPNPSYTNGTSVGGDRFCGNQFPTVTSSSKPFVLTVVTDANEVATPDIANRGFSLNYQQLPCNSMNNQLRIT